eukprot:1215832-Karenia_brevis.AAC.1
MQQAVLRIHSCLPVKWLKEAVKFAAECLLLSRLNSGFLSDDCLSAGQWTLPPFVVAPAIL